MSDLIVYKSIKLKHKKNNVYKKDDHEYRLTLLKTNLRMIMILN